MAELTKVHARDIAEYLFLAGFSKKAVLELMSGPVKTMILKEGYTIPTSTENEWFNKDYEYSKWSQKFVHDMTFLGTPIEAAQTIGFRKMQPLIVKSGSKSKNPAGLKSAKFKGDIKKGMSEKILLIAAGEKFEEDLKPEFWEGVPFQNCECKYCQYYSICPSTLGENRR